MQNKTSDPLVAYNRRLIEVFRKRRQQFIEKVAELDITIERMSGITDILENQTPEPAAPTDAAVLGDTNVKVGAAF